MARLQPYFPNSHGRPRVDDRRVLSGIIFINRNRPRWRDAPKEYGRSKTLYNRWKRRGDKDIFLRMMEGLARPQAPCIPGRKSRNKTIKYDKRRYKRRNRSEIMFGRIKDCRRVAKRYDRCHVVFLSAIALAATLIFGFYQ